MTNPNDRDPYSEAADPVKIGCLLDNPKPFTDCALKIYQFVAEQYVASGRFERGFEFVGLRPWGPPAGSIQSSIEGFHSLVDQGCIAIIGGHHSDDSIALTKYADRHEIPFMATGASANVMSKWSFSLPWSSIPHDMFTIVSWLRRKGHKTVVVTWDMAAHCEEFFETFRVACARGGIQIVADERFPQTLVPNLDEIFDRAVRRFQKLEPDALVALGTGWVIPTWAGHVNKAGWDIPRIMNDCYHAATMPRFSANFEGWTGCTMWDDNNEVCNKFYADFYARFPEVPKFGHEMISLFRDAMTALIEGIVLAPILTRDGVRDGLEKVQMLPAASGGPRTCIGFSHYNHRGLQGPDIMVLRHYKDGKDRMEGYVELF